MKRILCILAAILLLSGLCACAMRPEPAVTPTDAPVVTQAPVVSEAPTLVLPDPAEGMTRLLSEAADLDGDGTVEQVLIDSDDEYYTVVTVVSGATVTSATIDYPYAPRLYALHTLWGDETRQIVVSGDTGSDDYTTWVFRYEGAVLKSVTLDGYAVELPGDGTLTLSVNVDLFGTYGGLVQYTIGQDLSATRSSDYEIEMHEGFAEERMLTVRRDGLTAKTAAGEAVALPVGTTLLLQSTNLQDVARCSSSLGEDVYLTVYRLPDDWQWYIDGVAEGEWFGELMYAG